MPRRGAHFAPRPVGESLFEGGLANLTHKFLRDLEGRGFSPRTIKTRRNGLRFFCTYAESLGIERPTEVTRELILHYRRHVLRARRKRDGRPLSAATHIHRLQPVKALFAWLTKSGVLLFNPASDFDIPKEPKRVPRNVMSAREVERVLEQPNIQTTLGLRDRAILELLYSTGMRRRELISLLLEDIHRDRGVLLVREGKTKRDRVVPIGERALLWLDKYLVDARPELVGEARDDAVFLTMHGNGIRPNTLSALCKRYVDEADVRKGSAHVFRHTMATLMLENGADVRYIQEMLGHVELNTTQIYTRVSISKLKQIHQSTHPATMRAVKMEGQ